MAEDQQCTLDTLALKLQHLEQTVALHREYQREQVTQAYDTLKMKLDEMNQFREENRDLTSKFATAEMVNERVQQLHIKVDTLAAHIEEGIGKRLTAIEMYKANMDGRFWIWGIIITVLTLLLQYWPLVKH